MGAQAASDHLRDDQVCTVRHEDARIKPLRGRVRPKDDAVLGTRESCLQRKANGCVIDGKELWYPYIHDAVFTSWLDLCEKLNANAKNIA